MARKKKKRHTNQNKKTTTTTTNDASESPPIEETKQELTTEQEIALESKNRRKLEKQEKAAERLRKKQEKEEIARMPGPSVLTLRHILIKHKDARNSFSKRTLMEVNKTKDEACSELQNILDQLKQIEDTGILESSFADFALLTSDCGTHASGGKLDVKRKQMHVNFENVAWELEVGGLGPNIVETDSGCHILMRLN